MCILVIVCQASTSTCFAAILRKTASTDSGTSARRTRIDGIGISRWANSLAIKESPPYLHDGRLLTLEDTVEFFNLVLELGLTAEEKSDVVAFLRQL